MKQKCLSWSFLVVVGVVVVCMMVSIQDGWAGERLPGWSSGLNFGPGWFLDGYLSTGGSGRAFLEYAPYIPEIGIKLTGGYLYFQDDVTVGKGGFMSSKTAVYNSFYCTGGLVYRLSRRHVVPFLTGNLGVYRYNKDTVEPGVGPIINGEHVSPYPVVNTKTGYALGVNGGGGIEWFLGNHLSLSLEGLIHLTFGEECDQILDVTAMFRFLPGK